MKTSMGLTQVHSTVELSPHMKIIVSAGDDLDDSPVDKDGAHVKGGLPKPGALKPKMSLDVKKWMRSYTMRYFDAVKKQLTLDFAVNDHEGVAVSWAMNAKAESYLGITGPGPTKYTDYFAQ